MPFIPTVRNAFRGPAQSERLRESLMGVTRIRYLLDQWRLRSVAVGLHQSLDKRAASVSWSVPMAPLPPEKPPSGPPAAIDDRKP